MSPFKKNEKVKIFEHAAMVASESVPLRDILGKQEVIVAGPRHMTWTEVQTVGSLRKIAKKESYRFYDVQLSQPNVIVRVEEAGLERV